MPLNYTVGPQRFSSSCSSFDTKQLYSISWWLIVEFSPSPSPPSLHYLIECSKPIFKDTVKNNFLVFRWNYCQCTKSDQNINYLKNYVLVAFDSEKFQIDTWTLKLEATGIDSTFFYLLHVPCASKIIPNSWKRSLSCTSATSNISLSLLWSSGWLNCLSTLVSILNFSYDVLVLWLKHVSTTCGASWLFIAVLVRATCFVIKKYNRVY